MKRRCSLRTQRCGFVDSAIRRGQSNRNFQYSYIEFYRLMLASAVRAHHAAEVAPIDKNMQMTQLGHHPIIWPVVDKWLPPARARVLDAGCGEGQLSYRLAKLGYSVTGIDLPGPSLEKARALLASSDYRWDIIAGSVEEFGAVNPSFDAVVSIEVIEHLYRPVTFLKNMARALRPGGILILSTPYHGWLKNVAISTLGLWDWHHQALDEGNHIKFWSKRTLSAALAKAGLEAVEWRGVGRTPLLWKSILVKALKPTQYSA